MKLKSNCYKHMTDSELIAIGVKNISIETWWNEFSSRNISLYNVPEYYKSAIEVLHNWRAYKYDV